LGAGRGDIPVPQDILDLIRPGQQVLIDDSRIKMHAVKVSTKETDDAVHNVTVTCEVERGGMISSRKNITLTDISADMPTLTARDKNQIKLVKKYGVTGVMQSFVRGAGDLYLLKDELRKNNADDVRIFAKIECRAGYEHIGEIAEGCDMVVVARGDLGNTYPLWELPRIQKEIAQVCKRADKPFMIATELLHSMERTAIPTRAEVSDIFNAVLDGASALMLTGETAIGDHPVRAMRYLTKTAGTAMMTNDPKIKKLLDMP
ncbi:MAG: pyruvate kinase, partial [Eubacterium sp.]|nr:pyruvate kinase [Eubacterium sp.]